MTDKDVSMHDGLEEFKVLYQEVGNDKYAQTVASPDLIVTTAITGQVTVTTAGTAVQGPDVPLFNGVWLMAHPSNVNNVAYGNTGANTVSMTTGMVLERSKISPPLQVSNLNQVWFNASTSGDKVCWVKA